VRSSPAALSTSVHRSHLTASLLVFDRAAIAARVAKERGIHLLFLESICDDVSVIATNIALKVSSGDPDYKDMTREAAEADFKQRIANYEKVYEPVDEPHLSYCKVINVGRTVEINRIGGYLESRVAYYLMNLHLKPRAIFLSRVRSAP
jgi:6-phosphofructo-2-kinase/fructose-2,6-biphosphatase 2